MLDAGTLASDASIEAAYPISPMQRDMLLHSMSSPGSGAYVQHAICDLRERVEPSLLERAWRRVVERHSILRTVFCIEAAGGPIQQVHRHVDVPWAHLDWRDAQSIAQETRFDAYLDADRLEDFALDRPAPMRIALFQLGDAHFRLLLTYHHALMDGRSVRIVLRELFDIHDALAAGRDPELPPPHPYREYVDWLARQDTAAAEAFWRDALEGFVAPPRLPEKRAQSTDAGRDGYASAELRVSPKSADALRSFARNHDLTLNTLLLAAWARVIARYSGEADVAFDTTLALRGARTDGLRDVVGLCINTVPMRVRVEPDMPLLPWLEGVRAGWIAMRPHAWMPLASIHRCAGARGAQLMSSLVVYEHALLGVLLREDRPSWTMREFSRRSGASHPLTLVAFGEPELLLKIAYAQSRFEPSMIGSMLEHLSTALEGATANQQAPVRAQPLLTEGETRRILVEWNDTRREFPLERYAHELVAEQAARTPDAIAVEATESRLTYRELDERANQIAHYLQRRGIAPGALVGLCLSPRTPELIVALLGILKAGAAYLPLDAGHPPERLEHILRDAGVSALIANEALSLRLRRVAGRMIPVDRDRQEIARESTVSPRVGLAPEDLAYVVYTSGSTGQPKGIRIPHRALTNHTLAVVEYYGYSSADRRLQFVSISSDVLISDVFPPLVSGATIVLRPESELRSIADFLRFLEDRRITVASVPSAYWHEWVSAMASNEATPFPSSLRVVISGMDSVRPDLFAVWRPRARGRVRWFNGYGPSENTCTATVYEADLSSDTVLDTIPIGRPIANVRIYILDANGEPVPIGVPGELYIGGRSVALGYLNRPDLTAERFVRDPFSGNPDDRLYRTGDLARYLSDGNIAFLGRADNQIKIRGYRVELAEVEAAVRRVAGVREAIVVARGGTDARKVVAYVIVSGPRPTPEDLRAQLRRTLPEYMVPAAIVPLDALPRTSNGKIDYAALPEPELGVGRSAGEHAPARDDLEKMLAAIWQDLLGVNQIGLRDNFFDSGGDSLLAIRMIDMVERACGVSIVPPAFFAEPTIERLAESVRTACQMDAENRVGDGRMNPYL